VSLAYLAQELESIHVRHGDIKEYKGRNFSL
jgi:hypothetical protein